MDKVETIEFLKNFTSGHFVQVLLQVLERSRWSSSYLIKYFLLILWCKGERSVNSGKHDSLLPTAYSRISLWEYRNFLGDTGLYT